MRGAGLGCTHTCNMVGSIKSCMTPVEAGGGAPLPERASSVEVLVGAPFAPGGLCILAPVHEAGVAQGRGWGVGAA